MTTTDERSLAGIDDQLKDSHSVTKRLLIALDVDGTLVDHDGYMTGEVRQAAQAIVADGHEVILATGRSLRATLPIVEQLGISRGYCICCNGGVTVRLDAKLTEGYEIINRITFDPRHVLLALRKKLPVAMYALEDETGRFLSTERFQDISFGLEAEGVDFHRLLEATAVRVVVHSAESTSEQFAEAIESAGLHGVTYSVGWTAWLDIAAAGVNKASALETLRQELDIDPALTLAIGDGRNDVEMLNWAARGVAMGQAPEEVLAVASEVTASVYDDGAAKVLRALLNGSK